MPGAIPFTAPRRFRPGSPRRHADCLRPHPQAALLCGAQQDVRVL